MTQKIELNSQGYYNYNPHVQNNGGNRKHVREISNCMKKIHIKLRVEKNTMSKMKMYWVGLKAD